MNPLKAVSDIVSPYTKRAQHKELQQRLAVIEDSVPHVNSGGCAIVALGAQKHLHNNGNTTAEIIYLYESYGHNYACKVKRGAPISCHHAMIKAGRYYYDSEGRYTKKELKEMGYAHIIPVTPALVEQSIRVASWNDTFNRYYVSTIASILEVELSI